MSAGTPYIGSKISLISKAEIRYEGTLYAVDTKESTVTLQKVKSFGTESRPVSKHVPPRSEVYEYIIFRGSDIKDLHVSEVTKQEEQPPDPAILSRSAPVATLTVTSPNTSNAQFQPIQQTQQAQAAPSGVLPQMPYPPNPMGAYNPFAMPYFRPPPMMGTLPPPHHHHHPHLPNPQLLPPQMLQRPPPPGGMMTGRYLPPPQYPPHFMMPSPHPHMVPWQHQQQQQDPSEESVQPGGGVGGSWQQPQLGMEPPVQVISTQSLLPTYPQPQAPQQEELMANGGEEEEEEGGEIMMGIAQPNLSGGGWPLLLPQHLVTSEQQSLSSQAPVPTWLQPSSKGNTSQQFALPPSQPSKGSTLQQSALPSSQPSKGSTSQQSALPPSQPSKGSTSQQSAIPPSQPSKGNTSQQSALPQSQSSKGSTLQQSALPPSSQGGFQGKLQPDAPPKSSPPHSSLVQASVEKISSGTVPGKQASLPMQQPVPSAPPASLPMGIPGTTVVPPWKQQQQQTKPNLQENMMPVTTSNLSAMPVSLPSTAVMTTPRPVEPATAKEATTVTRPAPNYRAAKPSEAKQDPQQRTSKVPLTPKQLQSGQTSPSSGNTAATAVDPKPAEDREEQQKPLSASRRSHQDQRQAAQPMQASTEGRGGHRRENHQRGPPRKDTQQQQQRVFRYDREFDFESANARFDKENLEEEFKHKAKIVDGVRKAGDEQEECEDGELELDDEGEDDGEEVEQQSEVVYDKKKSFFDNISCDTNKTGGNPHTGRHEERALNTETFGVSTVHGYRYGSRGGRGRGGHYRPRGRRGGSGHSSTGRDQDGGTLTDGRGGYGNGSGRGGSGGGGHYSNRHGRDRQNHSREHPQGQRRWYNNNREQLPPQPQVEKN